MKVTQEQLPDSQVGLQIEIPGNVAKQTYDQTVQRLAKQLTIPGFRKGKVPRHVLTQRLGVQRIKATALEELINKGVQQAIEQAEIEAIGNYQVRSSFEELVQQFTPGESFTFSASVDVKPAVKLQDYRGLSVQAEEVAYDTERPDKVLDDYRKQMATLIPAEDRPAQAGDVAIVDFKGVFAESTTDDADAEPEPIPGGSGEDIQIDLTEGQFIPGFVEGIIGMEPGDQKELNLAFPEDYAQPDLAGKDAIFTIILHELKERELPEFNDDFAQEVSDFETLAELRESLEQRYQDEAETQTKANKHEALLAALLEQIEVEVPQTLVDTESRIMLSQLVARLGQQGMDVNKLLTPELVERYRTESRPEAIRQIKQNLAIAKIAAQEAIEVPEPDVEAKVQNILSQAKDPKQYDLERLYAVIREEFLQEKVMDWLEAENTVELVPEGTLSTADESDASHAEEPLAEASATTVEAVAEAVAEPQPETASATVQTADTDVEPKDTEQ